MSIRIEVASGGHTYPVLIADGLGRTLGAVLDQAGLGPQRFVVSTPVVWRFHGATIRTTLPGAEPILIPDGERFKTTQTVGRIYEALIRAKADRGAVVVTVGGGVAGDVGGFAAATFLRGVALAHVPTTLLAQVDSAIGGKVGVNHPLGKNLIGAFHPPRLVVVDPGLLRTLPRREFRAGLYEVVKYGVIASRTLFDRVAAYLTAIFAREPDALLPTIAECCRIKAEIVAADEREQGPRRVLNLGHTVGHALEAVTRYRRFRHGEAVAWGMMAAADLAVARRLLPDADRDVLSNLLAQMGPLPPVGDLTPGPILDAIGRDKKRRNGRVPFVLPTAIGATTILDDVREAEIKAALRKIGIRS